MDETYVDDVIGPAPTLTVDGVHYYARWRCPDCRWTFSLNAIRGGDDQVQAAAAAHVCA